MIASPALRSAPSAPTVVSVISPAGTMIHARRGTSSLRDEVLERARARRSLGVERRDGVGADVVDDAGVAVAHQPAHDVRAHPAQADHAELHAPSLYARQRDDGRVEGARDGQDGRSRSALSRAVARDATRRDTIEIHEAEGAFERLEEWLRDARLLRAGRRGPRRRPVPGLRPLVDDPATPLGRTARAVPAAARGLCRPARGLCCQ